MSSLKSSMVKVKLLFSPATRSIGSVIPLTRACVGRVRAGECATVRLKGPEDTPPETLKWYSTVKVSPIVTTLPAVGAVFVIAVMAPLQMRG